MADIKELEHIAGFAGMEFCSFRLKSGVSETDLLALAMKLDKQFLASETGFLGHILLKGRDGLYADVSFASSQADAESICGKWMENEIALEYLEFINHDTINLSFWNRIK